MAEFIGADVPKASDVERAIRTTANTHKKLDILVNNDGITKGPLPLENLEEEL